MIGGTGDCEGLAHEPRRVRPRRTNFWERCVIGGAGDYAGLAHEKVRLRTHPTPNGLKRGRCAAREAEPVNPAPDEVVGAIEPHGSRQTWAIVEPGRLVAVPLDRDRRLTVAPGVPVVQNLSVATVRLHIGHMDRTMDGTMAIMMVVIATDRHASECAATAGQNRCSEHRKAD